jgi:hypothetical protein
MVEAKTQAERDKTATPRAEGEPSYINAVVGPYKGKILKVTAEQAAAAISDGWAIDPATELDPDAPALQGDQLLQTIARAEEAANELRGEPNIEPTPKDNKSRDQRRDQTAKPVQAGRGYETRSAE